MQKIDYICDICGNQIPNEHITEKERVGMYPRPVGCVIPAGLKLKLTFTSLSNVGSGVQADIDTCQECFTKATGKPFSNVLRPAAGTEQENLLSVLEEFIGECVANEISNQA